MDGDGSVGSVILFFGIIFIIFIFLCLPLCLSIAYVMKLV